MWVRVPPSVPKIVVFENNQILFFFYQISSGTRKGGSENSPVDYFPDAGCTVPPSVPKIVVFENNQILFFYIKFNSNKHIENYITT